MAYSRTHEFSDGGFYSLKTLLAGLHMITFLCFLDGYYEGVANDVKRQGEKN